MAMRRLTTLGSLIRRPANSDDNPPADVDTPEANVVRGIKQFCETGAANSGEEVLYLPTIVEAAVATPKAAETACHQIRKFLSKDNYSRPHVQYNAVMLIRILADNPGESFTKHMDKSFADTVKHLLRNGRDPSVAQILRESLDSLHRDKAHDGNLAPLFAMWRKERGLMENAQRQVGPRSLRVPAWNDQQQQMGFQSGRHSTPRTLPPPGELSGRIEEARTSAKLLLQLVQSTPAQELLSNDLIKEFSERCMSAQRSIQVYINCDSPPPDDDTMLTLIETNEQLSLAASKHQRALLQARRALGVSPSPPNPSTGAYPPPAGPSNAYSPSASSLTPPPQPPRPNQALVLPPLDVGSNQAPAAHHSPNTTYPSDVPPVPQTGGSSQRPIPSPVSENDNPFADHHSSGYAAPQPQIRRVEQGGHTNGYGQQDAQVPYHPGFQSTPSYLNRQESSANNLTMHGASPVADGNYQGRPRTPDAARNQHSDVSPVAERSPVTYRY